ncbi:hypothetical protein BDC45DRAFT_537467 [Circinella umbellata]|nr:hypothetical protein BDC45DRAFT_537467 [Circinella umbellata]
MLLRFKQNIVNNRTINNESTINRTTAIESSAMESSLFEVIITSSKHYKHLQIAAAAEAAIIISLKTFKIHVPFVTPLSVKGTKKHVIRAHLHSQLPPPTIGIKK